MLAVAPLAALRTDAPSLHRIVEGRRRIVGKVGQGVGPSSEALFTRMSTRSYRSSVSATSRSRSRVDRRSTGTAAWEDLTPLARNESICWVLWPKKAETRSQHIQRLQSELLEGKRRRCCWLGCIHRKDKELSPSVRWVLSIRSKASK